MEKIGDILKRKRLEENISLEKAAEETMIASRYLDALENSNFTFFPGDVYAKGFLKRYAEYLKIEEEKINMLIAQYEEVYEKNKDKGESPVIEKAPVQKIVSAHRKNLYLYIFLTILGLIITGGILIGVIIPWMEREPKIYIDNTKLLSHQEILEKEKLIEERRKEEKIEEQKKLEIKGVMLEGDAFDEVWIKVQIDSGKKKDVLIRAGEKVKWHARKKIYITIGNAGAIAWKYNNKPIGTLGKDGVVKTIVFTEKKYYTVIKKRKRIRQSPPIHVKQPNIEQPKQLRKNVQINDAKNNRERQPKQTDMSVSQQINLLGKQDNATQTVKNNDRSSVQQNSIIDDKDSVIPLQDSHNTSQEEEKDNYTNSISTNKE
jgi:transcriptional regulator with XRE-family HTH domain